MLIIFENKNKLHLRLGFFPSLGVQFNIGSYLVVESFRTSEMLQ